MNTVTMNTAQTPIPTHSTKTKEYWVKLYLKDPYSIKFLGPFSSLDEAQIAQEQNTKRLKSEGQQIVSSFKIIPSSRPIIPPHPMNHAQWLQGLMENYLNLKVSST